MRMPDTIPARRHPHQVFVAGFAILAGLPVLLGGPSAGSLSASLPGWLLAVWGFTLTVGGLAILGAAAVRSAITALYLEAAAHLPLAIMAYAYAAALVNLAGIRGLSAAAIVAGFGLASTVRAAQVIRTLRRLGRAVQRQVGA